MSTFLVWINCIFVIYKKIYFLSEINQLMKFSVQINMYVWLLKISSHFWRVIFLVKSKNPFLDLLN